MHPVSRDTRYCSKPGRPRERLLTHAHLMEFNDLAGDPPDGSPGDPLVGSLGDPSHESLSGQVTFFFA